MKNKKLLIILMLFITILSFIGCTDYSKSKPTYETIVEQVDATIVKIDKREWFAGNQKREIELKVQDAKYSLTSWYSDFVSGMWDNPKYWDKENGDIIQVTITTVINKDTGEVTSRTLDFN